MLPGIANIATFAKLLGAFWSSRMEERKFAPLRYVREVALNRYVDWFSAPPLLDSRLSLVEFDRNFATGGDRYGGYYFIFMRLTPHNDFNAEVLAHELYHCAVTCRSTNKICVPLDELVAGQAAREVLMDCGLAPYAHMREQNCLMNDTRCLDVIKFMGSRYWDCRSVNEAADPDMLVGYNDAQRVGRALSSLVGWRSLGKLAMCSSMDEWIAGLEQKRRRELLLALIANQDVAERYIHEGCSEGRESEAIGLVQALLWLGRFDEAIKLAKSLVSYGAGSSRMKRLLADCLCINDLHEEGLQIYADMVDEHKDDPTFQLDYAIHLLWEGRGAEALHQFRNMRDSTSELPEYQYHHAIALRYEACDREANAIFTRLTAMSNPFIANAASDVLKTGAVKLLPTYASL